MRKFIISLFFLPGFLSLPARAADGLADHAPERYVVVKGDTLWSIAARFLKDPWRWPELWRMNREQVKNPHRIYPGDVLVLDVSGGSPVLRLAERTVKLNPRVRSEPTKEAAIPSIPPSAIEPFLTRPRVLEKKALEAAPRIIATQDNRVVLAAGDLAYVEGLSKDQGRNWEIYRPGRALVDPDTQETLGYEATYLGQARVERFDKLSTVRITQANQEVGRGDRLFPAEERVFQPYVPHAPEKPVTGRIIAAYHGVSEVGQNAIVVIDRGARDGLEPGNVLQVLSSRVQTAYTDREKVDLPREPSGLVFVFKVFDRVSYALVMETRRPVAVLDLVRNP